VATQKHSSRTWPVLTAPEKTPKLKTRPCYMTSVSHVSCTGYSHKHRHQLWGSWYLCAYGISQWMGTSTSSFLTTTYQFSQLL